MREEMPMKSAKKNRTACLITAGVVVLSAFLGCNRSLAALRGKTERIILQGDGSGYSISTDGQDLVNTARNLVTVAKKYIPGEKALFEDLERYCRQMEDAKTDSAERKNAALGIRSVCEAIHMRLSETGSLSEKDEGYLVGFQVELDAAMHRMSADPYNDAAQDFNDAERGFPANVLGVFVGPLPTFDF